MPNAFNAQTSRRVGKRRPAGFGDAPKRPDPLPGYRPKRRLPAGGASAVAWSMENSPAPTLSPTSFRDITDEMIGLPRDPVAQERAERFMRAAIAHPGSTSSRRPPRPPGKPPRYMSI